MKDVDRSMWIMNHFIRAIVLGVALLSAPVGSWAAEAGSPNDQTIESWITEALRNDSRIDASKIKVIVLDGIARLGGIVPNLSSKEYAALEAKKFIGVQAVINEIVVELIPRPDADIKKDLFREYQKDPIIDVFAVDAEVKEGNVTLTGQVSSWSQRSEAGMLASEVLGVRSVVNRIEVRCESSRPDEEIRQDIIASLHRDVYLTHQPITVSVEAGFVTLSGRTANVYEKERAADRARRVDNVKGVVDLIDVWGSERTGVRAGAAAPTNQDLAKDVRDELYQDLRIADPFEIRVAAAGRSVTLRGKVATAYEKRVATQDAHNVVGVGGVTNLLSVRSRGRQGESIRDEVRSDLASDSVLSGLNIDVRVTDGVVTLAGEANSLYEKEHAADVAARTPGVTEVINRIELKRVLRPTGTVLKDLIETRLAVNPQTSGVADRIEVRVEGDIVTLAGEVNTWSEYKEAAAIASYTRGVSVVINRLRVVYR